MSAFGFVGFIFFFFQIEIFFFFFATFPRPRDLGGRRFDLRPPGVPSLPDAACGGGAAGGGGLGSAATCGSSSTGVSWRPTVI